MTDTRNSLHLTELDLMDLRQAMGEAVLAVSRERGTFIHPEVRFDIIERLLRLPVIRAALAVQMDDLSSDRVGELIHQTVATQGTKVLQ